MLFSDRVKLGKWYKEWAEENHVLDVPESMIAFLEINGLIDQEAFKRMKDDRSKNQGSL